MKADRPGVAKIRLGDREVTIRARDEKVAAEVAARLAPPAGEAPPSASARRRMQQLPLFPEIP